MLLLLATRLDAEGRAEPDLALELDRDGQVVASQFLELAHQDNDDDLDDSLHVRSLGPRELAAYG